jgi:hypothetical protein
MIVPSDLLSATLSRHPNPTLRSLLEEGLVQSVDVIGGREVVVGGHGVERQREHEILQLFMSDEFDLSSFARLAVHLQSHSHEEGKR